MRWIQWLGWEVFLLWWGLWARLPGISLFIHSEYTRQGTDGDFLFFLAFNFKIEVNFNLKNQQKTKFHYTFVFTDKKRKRQKNNLSSYLI